MDLSNPHGLRGLSRGRDAWLVVLLYSVLTLLLAYPLSLNLTSLRLPTGPDGDLCMWILAWDTHAFTHQPFSIFDANIYFPQRLTLAYAENLIGSALFAAPVLWLTDNPTLASNFIGLLSAVLCGLGAFVLARRLGVGPSGAVLSGLIFAFAPPRFFRLGQLHLTAVQWIPFGLASLHAYLDNGRKRDLRLAAGFFTLQALSSGYGAVFISVSMVGLLAYRVALGEPIRLLRRWGDLGLTGALLLLPAVLVFLPYRAVQLEVGLKRGLGGWGVDPTSFIASPSHVQRILLSAVGAEGVYSTASAFLFPGYLPVLLAAVALVWRRRRIGADSFVTPNALQPTAVSATHGPDRSRPPAAQEFAATPSGTIGSASSAGSRGAVAGPQAKAALDPDVRLTDLQRPTPVSSTSSRPAPRTAWSWAAVMINLAILGTLALAVAATVNGPIRLRLGTTLLLSARDSSRLWIACLALLAIRVAILRLAPFSALRRLRQVWAIYLWLLSAYGRLLVRLWRVAKSLWRWIGDTRRRAVDRVRQIARATWARAEPARRRMLIAWASLAPVRRWAGVRRRDVTTFYGMLTLVSFWLAMGPPYGLWQFVYWIPGFTFIRECSRFAIVGLLGLAVLAGIGFDRVAVNLTRTRRRVLALTAGLFLIAEFAAMPLEVQPTTAVIPLIDRWLDTQPKPFVVAEVPLPRPSQVGPFERRQAAFMIHSTAHWQKTVHGYSGWRTPFHESLYWEMLDFPNETLLRTLAAIGVTRIVVHTELYEPGEWARVETLIEHSASWLTLDHVEGTGRAYSLRRPAHDAANPRAAGGDR
jgi:hypothetical protein